MKITNEHKNYALYCMIFRNTSSQFLFSLDFVFILYAPRSHNSWLNYYKLSDRSRKSLCVFFSLFPFRVTYKQPTQSTTIKQNKKNSYSEWSSFHSQSSPFFLVSKIEKWEIKQQQEQQLEKQLQICISIS